jgi:hypothetical protein
METLLHEFAHYVARADVGRARTPRRHAAIRTFLSYFLDREVEDTRQRQKPVRELRVTPSRVATDTAS